MTARTPKNRAFTLVEMMVAVAVFALMMGLLAELLGNAVNATHFTRQEMNASDSARQVLDALGADLENMIGVNGLTLLVSQDANNNTTLSFLTESRAPSTQTDARFMSVAYRLTNGNIIRSISPMLWTTTGLATAMAETASSSTSSVLALAGLRLEAVLVLDNGSIVPLSQNGSWLISTVNGEQLPAGCYGLVLSTPPADPNNPKVSAIVVGVATLDEQSFKLGTAKNMGGSLPSPSSEQTPVDEWDAVRGTSQFTQSYPLPAVSALCFGQQFYTLK